MSVISRFKAIYIIDRRKAFYRQRIPESSCASRVLARPYLMMLYIIFPIHLSLPITSKPVFKAIITRKNSGLFYGYLRTKAFISGDLCMYNVMPWNIFSQNSVFQCSMGCTKKNFFLSTMVATFGKYLSNFLISRKCQQF